MLRGKSPFGTVAEGVYSYASGAALGASQTLKSSVGVGVQSLVGSGLDGLSLSKVVGRSYIAVGAVLFTKLIGEAVLSEACKASCGQ
jgi:hypothetical protein